MPEFYQNCIREPFLTPRPFAESPCPSPMKGNERLLQKKRAGSSLQSTEYKKVVLQRAALICRKHFILLRCLTKLFISFHADTATLSWSSPSLRPSEPQRLHHRRQVHSRGNHSLDLNAYFVRLGPLPPKPDVYLDQLKPLERPPPDWVWKPKTNLAYTGAPLSIRDSKIKFFKLPVALW